jgi:CRP-like cAMP-binding protein
MTNQDNFIQKLIEIHPISSKEKEEISKILIKQNFKAKQNLLRNGEVSDRVFFVLEGLVRGYYYDEKQQEHSTWFVTDGGFIYSVMSYVHQKPSFEYIEALEDTTVFSLKKEDIYKMIHFSSNLAIIYARLTEQYLAVYDQRHRSLQLKPEERYERFTSQYPKLEARLKIDHLASYLGIGRSTLLDLRKKVQK